MFATTCRAIARQTALHFARHALVLLAVAAVYFLAVDPSDKTSVTRPPAAGSAAALVTANDCGSHVQDPTHVVVTVDGVTRYAGQRLTDQAIEQALFGVDHGLTVHGFCR